MLDVLSLSHAQDSNHSSGGLILSRTEIESRFVRSLCTLGHLVNNARQYYDFASQQETDREKNK